MCVCVLEPGVGVYGFGACRLNDLKMPPTQAVRRRDAQPYFSNIGSLDNYRNYFGGLGHSMPQSPILILKAPTFAVLGTATQTT